MYVKTEDCRRYSPLLYTEQGMERPQEVAAFFAPMPEIFKYYRPQHRHFLLDESRVQGEESDKVRG